MNRIAVLGTAIVMALSFASCAPQYARKGLRGKTSSSTKTTANPFASGGEFEEETDLPTWEGNGTASGGNGDEYEEVATQSPPYVMEVRGTGDAEIKLNAVPVGRKLRVKFIPGINDRAISGSNFSPQYSKLGLYMTVGAQSQSTAMLSNGLKSDAEGSILDFSAEARRNCGNDAECREDTEIVITKPNNDYWCMNWGRYCPYARVHYTHPWNGTVIIETDDTETIESYEAANSGE